MKRLPVGIQTFEKLIKGNYVYVDKTGFAKELIENEGYYFLSRPRRFGKSLFVSTLKEILKGNKDLFEEFQIYSSDYAWKEHPVIHLDFAQVPHKTPEDLELGLKELLDKIANSYGVQIEGTSLELRFASLVESLFKLGPVTVLVDEYDKPIIDHLSNPELADKNRNRLRGFFSTLKSLDPYLSFVFLTGVSKFSQVSLFSGFNNLEDLTLNPKYATLAGYTKYELDTYFQEQIEAVAKMNTESPEAIYAQLKEWYNGYRFSESPELVYNPFSTLSYLKHGKISGYWFASGTPSFLIEQIKRSPTSATQLSGSLMKRMELSDICDMEDIDLRALMWQSGYLTFKDYDTVTDLYKLDFPNKEVRQAFFDSILQQFAKLRLATISKDAQKIQGYLQNCELDLFFKGMNIYFAKVPYQLSSQAKECVYHVLFLGLMEGMGIKTHAEDPTNIGRIDLVAELPEITCIFEFKLDESADNALEQIDIKNYKEKYLYNEKKILTIGVNFSSEKRSISDWKGRLFSSAGKQVKEWTPQS